MRVLVALLAVVLIGVCLGAEQNAASPQQGKEPAYQGKNLAQWSKLTESKEAARRVEAATALGNFDPGGAPALVNLLRDADPTVRVAAAEAIAKQRFHAGTEIPVLTKLLADKDDRVRQAAATAIGEIGFNGESAIPVLMKMLKDQNSQIRQAAAFALGKIGTGPRESIPDLIEMLKDKDAGARQAAATALGRACFF